MVARSLGGAGQPLAPPSRLQDHVSVEAQKEPAPPPTKVCQTPQASVTVSGTVVARARLWAVTVNWTVLGLPVGVWLKAWVWAVAPPSTLIEALARARGAPKSIREMLPAPAWTVTL